MEVIKELRKLRGVTQAELCTAIKIAQPTLSGYEKGLHEPDTETLLKLADFFNVTVDYLLGREDETPVSAHTPTTNEQTEAERELLTLFRELSPYLQDLTLQTVRNWAGKAGKPGEVNIQKKA